MSDWLGDGDQGASLAPEKGLTELSQNVKSVFVLISKLFLKDKM